MAGGSVVGKGVWKRVCGSSSVTREECDSAGRDYSFGG
jgi:hypothetical protein